MEIWRACREATQHRTFELADVGKLARGECAPRIGDDLDRATGPRDLATVVEGDALLLQRVEWQGGGAPGRVSDADIERRDDRVASAVRRIVTGGAGAFERHGQRRIEWTVKVQSGDAGNRERSGVENFLSPRDRAPRFAHGISARNLTPCIVEVEYLWVERRTGAIVAEIVVD